MPTHAGPTVLAVLMLFVLGSCAGHDQAEVSIIGTIPDLAKETGVRFAGLDDRTALEPGLAEQADQQITEQLGDAGFGPNPAASVRLLSKVAERDGTAGDHLVVLVSLELVRTDRLLALAEVSSRRGAGASEDSAWRAVARGTIRFIQATGLQPWAPSD